MIDDNKELHEFEVLAKQESTTTRFKEINDKKYQIVLKKKTELNQDYHKNTKLLSSNHLLIAIIYGMTNFY